MDPIGMVIIVVGCWLISGVLLAVVVPQLRSWRRIMRAGIPVTGTVTKIEDDFEGDPWTVIEYRVGTTTHTLRICQYGGRPSDAVPLLVDPVRPEKAIVRATAWRRGVVLVFALALGILASLCITIPILLAAAGIG